jgi:hypothetical protein
MQPLGKIVISLGLFLVLFGSLLAFWDRLPLLGKLPGDLVLQKGSIRIFLPLTTSLLLSILLTVAANVVLRLLK